VIRTLPEVRPPVAAVYVNVIVLPVAPAVTFDVGVVSVPEPFGDGTRTVWADCAVEPAPRAFDAPTRTRTVEPESVALRT